MLKVMHITYDMRIGGTEMVIQNIINGLNGIAFQMSIFCIEKPLGPWGLELEKKGIRIEQEQRKEGFDLNLIQKIRKHIKLNNIDIIHCHQYTPWVYGALASLLTGTKVIFTEHGRFYPDSSSWKRKFANPFLLKLTDKVTSISAATKKALIDYEHIPSNRIEIIYNGIKPLKTEQDAVNTLRKRLKIPSDNKVVGTVARLDPIKNHKMMLRAFAQVLTFHPNTSLLIVGDGEERQNIDYWINKLNIKSNVILVGYQSAPSHHIALMDIFLLSSFSEGTSMTLLEAMSLGKPCVVTDAGGNPEIVLHKKTGFVTPNDDYVRFADAIVTMLSSKDKDFSDSSQKRFFNNFSNKIMNQQFQALYWETLNG